MSATVSIPSQPPISNERAARLAETLDGLDGDALLWVSGFVAGLAQARRMADTPSERTAERAAPQPRLTVLYGSQTGNARRLAERLAARAEAAGLAVRLLRADEYPLRELKDERLLYLVISTQGDGDPPDDSLTLVEHLSGRRAPVLKQLSFAVLGLGDSSYPQFCAVARRLDARLAELGATRLFAPGQADVDIDPVAVPWLDQALEEASRQLRRAPQSATVTPLRPIPPAAPSHGRETPFPAELLVNQRITGRGSDRDVRHLELSLDGAGLAYQPGDALGVWPQNDPALVERVLERLRLQGEMVVTVSGEPTRLDEALRRHRELTRVSRPLLIAQAGRVDSAALRTLAQDGGAFRAWLQDHQVIDLFERWPASWSPQELVDTLPALVPRLYSIASSPTECASEVHLTVAVVRAGEGERQRTGAASGDLARTAEGARVKVFIEPNERFRLPSDGDRDLIMIGPGTGVAPFRAFVQHRAASGASGRHWLFFVARRFREDFLYQIEWQRALKQGRLQRLDLAFSRDRAARVHVHDRLLERGRELFDWLQGGAHLYVCGAMAMGKGVHHALLEIAKRHAGLDGDRAEDWLRSLQQQGRYARDVY